MNIMKIIQQKSSQLNPVFYEALMKNRKLFSGVYQSVCHSALNHLKSISLLDFDSSKRTRVQNMLSLFGSTQLWTNILSILVFSSNQYTPSFPSFKQVAMEMLFTGTPISAHDALLHGLVSKVVPEEQLEEETLAIAQRICKASRPVVALGKATFQRWEFTVCKLTDCFHGNNFIGISDGISSSF